MTLSDFLARNGISHAEFARQIGVSQVAVTRYAGGNRMPRPDQMRRITEATNGAVTANDFVGTAQSGEAA